MKDSEHVGIIVKLMLASFGAPTRAAGMVKYVLRGQYLQNAGAKLWKKSIAGKVFNDTSAYFAPDLCLKHFATASWSAICTPGGYRWAIMIAAIDKK